MVVTLGLDVGVGHEEHGEDDRYDIPSREDQTWEDASDIKMRTPAWIEGRYLKVSATDPILSGAYQAEKATIAGTWSKQTCRAYAEPISMLKGISISDHEHLQVRE
jgi:hypothetical protein